MQVIKQPRIDTIIKPSQILTDTCNLIDVDLRTAGIQSLSFKKPYKLTAQRADRVYGLLAYFTASFDPNPPASPLSSSNNDTTGLDTAASASSSSRSSSSGSSGTALVKSFGKEQLMLNTDPLAAITRYQQTIFNFPKGIKVEKGDVVTGTLSCKPSELCSRDLDLQIELIYQGMHAKSLYALNHSHLHHSDASAAF